MTQQTKMRSPEKNWTVASLAEQVPMSRSAFAARFTQLVGQPPMQYLTKKAYAQSNRTITRKSVRTKKCSYFNRIRVRIALHPNYHHLLLLNNLLINLCLTTSKLTNCHLYRLKPYSYKVRLDSNLE